MTRRSGTRVVTTALLTGALTVGGAGLAFAQQYPAVSPTIPQSGPPYGQAAPAPRAMPAPPPGYAEESGPPPEHLGYAGEKGEPDWLVQGNRATHALNMLEANGFTQFSNFQAAGRLFTANVVKGGQPMVVTVNPDTNRIMPGAPSGAPAGA